MKVEDLVNKDVRILKSQSTFFIIEYNNSEFRIDFEDKKEFYIKKETKGKLSIETEHPLLIDYQEDFVTTFINSIYIEADELLKDFEIIINNQTKGYRNWKNYIENDVISLNVVKNNIITGSGKLLEAPISITNKIIELCDKLGIKTKTFGIENFNIEPYKILIISDNCIIAKDFKIRNK